MSSSFVKESAARLAAVQVIYQWLHAGGGMAEPLDDFLQKRVGMEIEGMKLEKPDGALLKRIVSGVERRKEDLMLLIESVQKKEKVALPSDFLLQSVFLAGAYELLEHGEIDPPLIINDYLNVAHAFYGKGEVSLINGILDALGKKLRD